MRIDYCFHFRCTTMLISFLYLKLFLEKICCSFFINEFEWLNSIVKWIVNDEKMIHQLISFNAIELNDKSIDILVHKRLMAFVLFSNRELKAASGEWMNDISREVQRAESYSNEHLSASEIIRKSIRRSWTISSELLLYPSHHHYYYSS